jgi:hypothetical protein
MRSITPRARRLALSLACSATLLLLLAPAALAADGRGYYGSTNDKVVVNWGFIVIVFFPLLALVLTLIQSRLEKRKEARRAAQLELSDPRWRGGW